MKKFYIEKNKFIAVLIFLFFLSGIDSYSQQHWRIISKPTNRNLWRCSFVDTLNGWAVGDSGTILNTSNGGYNWVTQNSKLNEYMVSVFFLNKRLGWALAWGLDQNYFGTYILKTTNGGVVWDTARYPVNDTYIRDLIFLDSLTGYMCGYPGIFHKTTNGGLNWYKCTLDTSIASGFPAGRFRFLNNKFGVNCGGVMDIAGIIWKTSNYGQYWTADIVAPEPITDIKLFDSINYIAVGGDYEYGASVLKTTNGGLNWSYRTLEIFGIPQVLAFRNNLEGWAPMGYMQKFIMTSDAGSNWVVTDTPDSTQVFDLTLKSNVFGIGVCLNGYVIKYFSCPTFSVSGSVKYNDNNLPVTNGMVKAFQLDKSSGNVIYLDSANIQSDGSYTLTNVPQDTVDIGVFPNSTPPNDYVITYYPSTIYWENATMLYPTGNLTDINIGAIRISPSTNSNSVNGRTSGVADFYTNYLKDAFIYAMNGNTFVRCAVSDAGGMYHLQSLPTGNLKIIATRLGFSRDSAVVNVTPTSNIDSINFQLHRISVGIKQISSTVPSEYKLYQNYPNPFNSMTNVKWQMLNAGNVKIVLFDIIGKEVVTLINEKQSPGVYEVMFDASWLPSGIYFYRLQAGDFIETKRMVLIK